MLSHEHVVVELFLVGPQSGVLHEILLLFAVVVLGHRPKIEILILVGVACGLFGVGFYGFVFVCVGLEGSAPGLQQLFVLEVGDLCAQGFVLLD